MQYAQEAAAEAAAELMSIENAAPMVAVGQKRLGGEIEENATKKNRVETPAGAVTVNEEHTMADKAHSQETNAAKLMDDANAASDKPARLAEEDRIRQEEERLAKLADELKEADDERSRLEEEGACMAKLTEEDKAADVENERVAKLADELREANDERARLEDARLAKLTESKAANVEEVRMAKLADELREADDERAQLAKLAEESLLAKVADELKTANDGRARLVAGDGHARYKEERLRLAKLTDDLKAADDKRTRLEEECARLAKLANDLEAAANERAQLAKLTEVSKLPVADVKSSGKVIVAKATEKENIQPAKTANKETNVTQKPTDLQEEEEAGIEHDKESNEDPKEGEGKKRGRGKTSVVTKNVPYEDMDEEAREEVRGQAPVM